MLKGAKAILKDAPSILEEMFVGLFVRPLKLMGSGFGSMRARIERWGRARFIKAIETVAILIAIFAFTIEMSDRRDEQTARAWQLVTTKASGNSGKVEALQYLNSQDREWLLGWWPYAKKRTSLEGIDLTPPALVDQWQDKEKSERTISWFDCPGRTYLVAVKLPKAAMSRTKLPCADLKFANLSKADFHEANLSGADLFGANLNEARLVTANLSGANLIGAVLTGANLHGANLHGAALFGAYLSGAILAGANLQGDNLSSADLSEAHLRGANLSEANLSGANLSGAKLFGTNLSGANLRGANLSEAILKRANLSGADLFDANVTGADFENAKGAPNLSNSCADPDNPPINLSDDAKRPEVWVPWPCLSEEGN